MREILLRRTGIESAIYEAWPYSKGIGGGLQIAPSGMHVMDEIGLANELISRGSLAESFDFCSQSGQRLGSINPRLMQQGQELSATFQAFEAERRPRTEKIVAMARRNGNSKHEFSATGAWMRNQMLKWLLPLGSKSMEFMYAYDARAA